MRTSEKLSPDCVMEAHNLCWHRADIVARINPRRVRPEVGINLCVCRCHSACPLTGRALVSRSEWDELCSCVGAESARKAIHAKQENDQRVKEAADAVRSRSAGKSRAEVRQMLLDELRSRSIKPPSGERISLTVDSIARFGEQTVRGRTGATRSLASFAGDVMAIFRLVKSSASVTDPTGQEPYYASPATIPAGIEVSLDEEAEKVLDAMNLDEELLNAMGGVHEPGPAASRAVMIPVRLQAASGADADGQSVMAGGGASGHHAVIAYVGKHRVGELNPDDGMALEQVLQAARQQNRSLTMCLLPSRYGRPGTARPLPGRPSLSVAAELG